MESNPDTEDIEDVPLEDERERHLRMVLNDNEKGINDEKALIHAKRWDVYYSDKI